MLRIFLREGRSCSDAARRRGPAPQDRQDRHRLGQVAGHYHDPCPAYRQGQHRSRHCHPARARAHRSGQHRSPQASDRRGQHRAHCLVHLPDQHRFRRCGAVRPVPGSCPANQVLPAQALSALAPKHCPSAQLARSRPVATPANGAAGANRGAVTQGSPYSDTVHLGLRPGCSNTKAAAEHGPAFRL